LTSSRGPSYASSLQRHLWFLFALCFTVAAGRAVQLTGDARVRRVLDSPKFKEAVGVIDRQHDRLVSDNIQLTEIPAPPFLEAARGKAFEALLRQTGLTNIETDPVGNVIGLRKGTGAGPLLAVAAHLDTVFPAGTDVTVKRQGTTLSAPGIGDDTRSLAVLLAIIRAMDAAKIQTASDILFVGDVGEEGPGDLRGMRYLFGKGAYRDRIKTFISVDGTGPGNDITNGGTGSKRYRVTFRGPGGHSYNAFGLVSPAFAMGYAIDKFSKITVPSSPKTTFNVGVIGGGTSVNSIPFETWMEIDMRSESPVELAKLDKAAAAAMQQAADDENRARSVAQGKITAGMKLIGDRPSGETSKDSELVQTAMTVVRLLDKSPRLSSSSTDSNIPMSLGIPAITLESGARGGRAHALDEWVDVEKTASLAGIRSLFAIILTMAGLN
jgi:tripeptide aminopeptidase